MLTSIALALCTVGTLLGASRLIEALHVGGTRPRRRSGYDIGDTFQVDGDGGGSDGGCGDGGGGCD